MPTAQDVLTYIEGLIAETPVGELGALVGVGLAVEKLIADALAGAHPAPDGIELAERAADAAEAAKLKDGG